MGLQPTYTAKNPPSANYKPKEPITDKNVPVTDGKERQLSDKDGFLKLFITQLQNQDPMNPMENTEMTAQLAQFSQLEQLANLNTSFTGMLSAVQSQNQFQSLNLIGKEIKAESNSLSMEKGKCATKANFEILEPGNVKINILDANGKSIRLIDMETLEKGNHEIVWDGKNNNGDIQADGRYYFQITATNLSGETLEAYPSIEGKVTSVTFDSTGQPILHLGSALASLSQIMEILQADKSETTTPEGETGAPDPDPEPEEDNVG